jgi:glycosyltransferase involved in cell wall biosynthesis
MLNLPLVSVIIPAFNAEMFISNCIDSVLSQSYKNIEIVIVDDGSIDKTKEIIDEYKINYNNINYVYQSNHGCSFAKNKALKYINGDFVQYLDADDILSPDKIELQLEAISNNQNAIAVCKTVVFKSVSYLDTGNEIDSSFLYSTDDSLSFVLNLYGLNGEYGMIQPNAFLVPRKIINEVGEWNTSLSPSPDEDGEYFCRVILAASKIKYTEGINYYRKLPNVASLSKKKSLEHAQGALKSILLKKNHILNRIDTSDVRKMFAFQLVNCANIYGELYLDILDQILLEIDALGFAKVPTSKLNGRFGLIARFIGFKDAIKLRKLFSKFKIYFFRPLCTKKNDIYLL